MRKETLSVTLGCLLHDTGKLCYRSGIGGKHSASGASFLKALGSGYEEADILDCVRFHHSAEIRAASLQNESNAYISWIADNISAAADRRTMEEEGSFERNLPLSPVFLHMNGDHAGYALQAKPQDGTLRMPARGTMALTAGDYEHLCRELANELKHIPPEEEWLNSVLALLETLTSNVPASTNTGESPDISLFDHTKIAAAVGACISEYLYSEKITDYKKALWDNEAEFRQKEAFLLYSADFSGIQKFIYTVSTANALRSLRSRSFFLELAMEHYIDELLEVCGLSRANLLYSGGGHCYLLLPNTEKVQAAATQWNTRWNRFLGANFGTALYLADGFTPCSANDLTNTPAEEKPYSAMFRRVSSEIGKKKLHRYSAQQIIELNALEEELSGRECRVCGRTANLIDTEEDTCLCPWCAAFERMSRKIQTQNVYLIERGNAQGADFVLPSFFGDASFRICDETAARKALAEKDQVLRIYTKNRTYAGLKYSTRLYVGDYAASNSLQELAESGEGINRLAVCRLDVDNLGQAFVAGFERKQAATIAEQQHFVTISRTAAFSRQMSLFFKRYINSILSGEFGLHAPLSVAIVYSGGDDVFLVGAWKDTIEAACRIRRALREFSLSSLTISGGIGVFDSHHPIRLAAQYTAELENEAKSLPGKNAVSLFAAEDGHAYSWDSFENEVLGEKLAELERFFSKDKTERGTAFLYRIVDLLREAQKDPKQKLPIAHLAYTLSRLEPKQSEPNYSHYKEFSQKLFGWALSNNDRKALITAINLFVYKRR